MGTGENNKKKSKKKDHTKSGLLKIGGAILTVATIVLGVKKAQK